MTAIVAPDRVGIERACALLKAGEVVAIPTETVYGLAGLALSESALLKIFEAKDRPHFDPLIAHIALPRHTVNILDYVERRKLVNLERLVGKARDRLDDVLSALWPGPLTVVLPRAAGVPDLLTAGLPRVALRMPAHPVAQEILESVGAPLAAPSANRFGRLSPTTAAAVAEELGDRIPLVVDGGACRVGIESTIIALGDDDRFVLLRPGGMPKERIEARLGQPLVLAADATGKTPMDAPGQLPSHYAPERPLTLIDSIADLDAAGGAPFGLLTWESRAVALPPGSTQLALTHAGALDEGARNLFSQLRALDRAPHTRIFAERCPNDTGLGYAINDRLRRAAHRGGA